MGVLDHKLRRDLWRLRGAVVAVALVVGCGVGTYVMSLGTLGSLNEARAIYYERQQFADVFARAKRAPQSLVKKISLISGVRQVETRIVQDVTLDIAGMDEPAVGRLVSIPENGRAGLNILTLRQGRTIIPGHSDEAVVSEAFALAHGLSPGDRFAAVINGRKRPITVVGIALSPEFIYAIGPGVLMPDNRRFGILWMGRRGLASAFDLDGAFNDVTLSLYRGGDAAAAIEQLDRLLGPFGGVGAYGRVDQVSNMFLTSEMDQLRTMSKIIPPIFLAVAGFLMNIIISRLIIMERGQIGLLKAFGYTNRAVGWHYIKFVLSIIVLGTVLGFLIGAWLGGLLTTLYTDFFHFPVLHYRLYPSVFLSAGAVTLLVGIVATMGAVRRAVQLSPAVAMAPAAPAVYRKAPGEGLMAALFAGEQYRMIARDIARWPVRAGLTVIGIALAEAVLISTLFFYDAIDSMIETYFYRSQRYDVAISFAEPRGSGVLDEVRRMPGVLASEPYRTVPVEFRSNGRKERSAIVGIDPKADLRQVLDVDLRSVTIPDQGLVLSVKMAEMLGVGAGDTIAVSALEGRRVKRDVHVAGVVEEYIGAFAYMARPALNRFMGEGQLVSGAYLMVDSLQSTTLYRDLKNTPAIAGVGLQVEELKTFRKTLAETMDIMIGFYIAFSSTMVIGVVYNAILIAMSERARDLATLRVMGFTRAEVSTILLGGVAVLTLFALPVGWALGYGLAWFMAWSFDTELYRIPMVIDQGTYGVASLVVVVATMVSGLIVRRRIDRLDLTEVLKAGG